MARNQVRYVRFDRQRRAWVTVPQPGPETITMYWSDALEAWVTVPD